MLFRSVSQSRYAGQLLTSTEKINGIENGTYNYVYKNGKLYAKKGVSQGKNEESVFEYNAVGRLSKITNTKSGEVNAVTEFSNDKTVGTYTQTTTFFYKGKPTRLNVKNYEDGNLLAEGERFGDKDIITFRKMEYNDKGLLVKSIATLS